MLEYVKIDLISSWRVSSEDSSISCISVDHRNYYEKLSLLKHDWKHPVAPHAEMS